MPLDLDALEALERHMNPGPWKFAVHNDGLDYGYVGATGKPTVLFGERHEGAVSADNAEAAALVAARNALPELIRLARIGDAKAYSSPARPGPLQECVSDLSERLRQYADIADAGGKAHWANAMREAMYTLAVYRQNAAKGEHDAHR